MFKFLKGTLFFCKISWIFFSEVSSYLLTLSATKERFIERLTTRLAEINILYVKIFQAIALNNNIIDENINNMLLRFTDNAPWTREDIDFDTLINLHEDFDICFTSGYTPINSGMISLVFKCMIGYNNNIVIVKCKRKNIDKKLDDAVDNLRFIIRLFSCLPRFNKFNINEIVEKNISLIKQQLCFNTEIKNLMLIKNNCKNLKYVKIPNVNSCVTEKYPNAIVMEYIQGLPINLIKKDDYLDFAKLVLKFGFVTTLIHGTTHGDLHSGNILFIKDENDAKYPYKIGVLDFGILLNIDNAFKNNLFVIISELFTLSPHQIAKNILSSGILEPIDKIRNLPKYHENIIINMLSEIIEDTVSISKTANQLKIYDFLHKFHSYINTTELAHLGIRPSDNFVKTQLALAMAHGVTMTLCENDYMNLADKVINELFHIDLLGLESKND